MENAKKDPFFITSLILGGLVVGFILGNMFGNSNTTTTAPILLGKNSGGGVDGAIGNINAPVTMVEYSDFMCPYCERFYKNKFDTIMNDYVATGKVRFVYKDFPIGSHANAKPAAVAARCAGKQGNYYGMHDALFLNMDLWNRSAQPNEIFIAMAKKLKLNKREFTTCLTSGEFDDDIKKSVQESVAKGNEGTPGFFINEQYLSGDRPMEQFKKIIDEELAKAQNATQVQ